MRQTAPVTAKSPLVRSMWVFQSLRNYLKGIKTKGGGTKF
jgi:hypothetical protein